MPRIFDELFNDETFTLRDKLQFITPIEKDVLINGLVALVADRSSKFNALTKKVSGQELDVVLISQPDFQLTYFGNSDDPLDKEQYVYIEGFLNHKKVDSRRFPVSEVERAASLVKSHEVVTSLDNLEIGPTPEEISNSI